MRMRVPRAKNARVMRRILMRGRESNFWGDRAYLTFGIPLSALPSMPPKEPAVTMDGWSVIKDPLGHFLERDESDGIRSQIHLHRFQTRRSGLGELRSDSEVIHITEYSDGESVSYTRAKVEMGRTGGREFMPLAIGKKDIVETRLLNASELTMAREFARYYSDRSD